MSLLREHAEAIGVDEARVASDLLEMMVQERNRVTATPLLEIRDNGTGIAPDVKEKMFNPFFTTKPTGEGTGLGLSISHDIVVKQHSGSIEVDTQLGEFTEIRIILPRTGVFL